MPAPEPTEVVHRLGDALLRDHRRHDLLLDHAPGWWEERPLGADLWSLTELTGHEL